MSNSFHFDSCCFMWQMFYVFSSFFFARFLFGSFYLFCLNTFSSVLLLCFCCFLILNTRLNFCTDVWAPRPPVCCLVPHWMPTMLPYFRCYWGSRAGCCCCVVEKMLKLWKWDHRFLCLLYIRFYCIFFTFPLFALMVLWFVSVAQAWVYPALETLPLSLSKNKTAGQWKEKFTSQGGRKSVLPVCSVFFSVFFVLCFASSLFPVLYLHSHHQLVSEAFWLVAFIFLLAPTINS